MGNIFSYSPCEVPYHVNVNRFMFVFMKDTNSFANSEKKKHDAA